MVIMLILYIQLYEKKIFKIYPLPVSDKTYFKLILLNTIRRVLLLWGRISKRFRASYN